jgi:hypothetical protein
VGDGNQVHVIRGGSFTTRATFTGVTASALRTLDWNGDGKAEVVIGDMAHERAFVVFGDSGLSSAADIVDRADWIITGESASDKFGYSLGSGDLDADGVADLIIGSRTHTLDNRPDPHFDDAGAVYVLYGATSLGPGPIPLTDVSISGPTEGVVNTAYVFTATVSPVTATQPITFSWQATGQTSAMHTSNSLSDTMAFTWPQGTAGAQAITVTAMNAAGAVTATRAFSISAASPSLVPLTGLVVSGPSSGVVNTDYVFTATVSPVTATLPITFTWQATGQIPLTRTGPSSSDSITFTWPLGAAGDQVITATAANAGGAATSALGVTIAAYKVYLPIVK